MASSRRRARHFLQWIGTDGLGRIEDKLGDGGGSCISYDWKISDRFVVKERARVEELAYAETVRRGIAPRTVDATPWLRPRHV